MLERGRKGWMVQTSGMFGSQMSSVAGYAHRSFHPSYLSKALTSP